jgi:hypothetical protein
MATFQLRYGCYIAESPVVTTTTFDEGTTMTVATATGYATPTTTATNKYGFVYTGYPSTRPDVLSVGKIKMVAGPGVIETDVISDDVHAANYGTEVQASSGMLCLSVTDVPIGYIIGKPTSTSVTVVLY